MIADAIARSTLLGASRRARLAPAFEDLRLGRFTLAAEGFEAAARHAHVEAPARMLAAEARLAAGLALVHSGEFAAARRELAAALELDPGQAAAARLLARVLLRCGEAEAALDRLDHAAIEGAESHGVLVLRAACLEAIGRPEEASRALDRALAAALETPLPGVRHRLRVATDLPAGACDDLAPAEAAHADRRCAVAVRLLDRRPGEAAAHLETALALNPRFLRAHLVLGLVRLQQRRATEAVEELEAARELEPTYPDVRAWLGLARLAAGNARGALRALERAITLRRTFARAHRHMALVRHALGFAAEARRAALRGWVRDTEVPAFPERPALAGLEAEGADEDQLRRAVAIRPRSPDLHLALGRRLEDRGDHGEARAAFRAALAIRPGYPAATLELARAEIARSRLQEAESLLAGLVGVKPSWVDAQALLGKTRLELGDARGALVPLRAATRLRPGLEPARSDLAWATLSQGRAQPPARRRSEAAA